MGQCALPLYLLIKLLDRKALTAVTIRLVSDDKLKRIQQRVTRNIQAKLFASWEKYKDNEKTAASHSRLVLGLTDQLVRTRTSLFSVNRINRLQINIGFNRVL